MELSVHPCRPTRTERGSTPGLRLHQRRVSSKPRRIASAGTIRALEDGEVRYEETEFGRRRTGVALARALVRTTSEDEGRRAPAREDQRRAIAACRSPAKKLMPASESSFAPSRFQQDNRGLNGLAIRAQLLTSGQRSPAWRYCSLSSVHPARTSARVSRLTDPHQPADRPLTPTTSRWQRRHLGGDRSPWSRCWPSVGALGIYTHRVPAVPSNSVPLPAPGLR